MSSRRLCSAAATLILGSRTLPALHAFPPILEANAPSGAVHRHSPLTIFEKRLTHQHLARSAPRHLICHSRHFLSTPPCILSQSSEVQPWSVHSPSSWHFAHFFSSPRLWLMPSPLATHPTKLPSSKRNKGTSSRRPTAPG